MLLVQLLRLQLVLAVLAVVVVVLEVVLTGCRAYIILGRSSGGGLFFFGLRRGSEGGDRV